MGFVGDLKKFQDKTLQAAEDVLDEVAAELQNRFEKRTPGRTPALPAPDGTGAKTKPTQRVIFNDCDYIEALEDGHSKQAPHGMVKTTLPEFPAIVDQAVKRVKGK